MTTFKEEVNKFFELDKTAEETPPKRNRSRSKCNKERTKLEKEIADLDKRIESGAMRLLECDERVRAALDKQLTKLVEQKEGLNARLRTDDAGIDSDHKLFHDDLIALAKWWSAFQDEAIPTSGGNHEKHDKPVTANASLIQVRDDEHIFGSWNASSLINEALHALGVSVYLCWRREERKAKRARNVLMPIRFRMGQGELQDMSEPSWLTNVVKSCAA